MIKVLISLISILVLSSCSKKEEDVVFINQQFKNELDNFILENNEQQKIIYLDIADGEDIFEDATKEDNEKTYLLFYYTEPNSCIGFYKSFEYRGKQILLYDFSDKVKFSDMLEIQKGENICNPELLYDGIVNTTIVKRYYFDENKKLVEIKNDGTLRKVE